MSEEILSNRLLFITIQHKTKLSQKPLREKLFNLKNFQISRALYNLQFHVYESIYRRVSFLLYW